MDAPENPAGPYQPEPNHGPARRQELIATIETTPAHLRNTVRGLSTVQLDTLYRNWTLRQIVHHLADSHVNSYIRFKWTLTEDRPTIKAYDEGRWAALEDSRSGDIEPPLLLLEGLHARWVQLLRGMTTEKFSRTFHHPESNQIVSLAEALGYYAWHCQHHVGQIQWRCNQNGWRT